MNLLKFRPVFYERIWGGRVLESLHRKLPESAVIGESWEICDRPEAQSIVAGGEFDGIALSDLLKTHGKEIMGPAWNISARFPIIIKWLDCRQRLSLQVHPTKSAAALFNGESKTEAWYFYKCDARSRFIAGLRNVENAETLMNNIVNSTMEKCVCSFKSSSGDFILVESGCVHSLGAGNLVLEIQQNSDTTYRIYDWSRPDLNGNLRELHLKESAASINFGLSANPISTIDLKDATLARTPHFVIRKLKISNGEHFCVEADFAPRIITLLNGKLRAGENFIDTFDSVLLPYCESFDFTAEDDCDMIITEIPVS